MDTKFEVIGFGHIRGRHATIANEYRNCEVVAVVDTNPATKEHELFPKGARYFECIEAFLDA